MFGNHFFLSFFLSFSHRNQKSSYVPYISEQILACLYVIAFEQQALILWESKSKQISLTPEPLSVLQPPLPFPPVPE